MKDSSGKIINDSLGAFYKLIDTTHRFHSIQCEAWCYEWAGTDFINALQKSTDTIACATEMNSGTHCSLRLTIAHGFCSPEIELAGIAATGSRTYKCTSGLIEIDRKLLKKGILKATFDFHFDHKENPGQPMYWKGSIYSAIEKP
jgi:hypothetical protein